MSLRTFRIEDAPEMTPFTSGNAPDRNSAGIASIPSGLPARETGNYPVQTSSIPIQATSASPKARQAMRKLADEAQMLFWMLDEDDVCVFMNESAHAIFEPGDKIDIWSWVEYIHPDDRDRALTAFYNSKRAFAEYKSEYRVVRSDGSVRWMMSTGAPCVDNEGRSRGFAGSLVDVTERYNMVERLAYKQTQLRLLTDHASDLISRHTASGEYLYVSPSCQQILGYSVEELIGQNAYDRINPDHHQLIADEIARQLNGGGDSQPLELRVRHKDGRLIWLGANIRVLTSPSTSEYIGAVVVSRNITEERLAKEELRRREEQFRSLTTLSSDWYWETDAEGRFTFLSEGLRNAIGIEPSAALGQTREEMSIDPSDPGIHTYRTCMAEHKPFQDMRFAMLFPGAGKVAHTRVSGEPIFDNGEYKGYHGVTSDVTAEVVTNARLAQLAAENQLLVESSPDLILLIDASGKVMRANQATLPIIGYHPDEFIGADYTRYVHPEDVETTLWVLREHDQTLPLKDFENRCIRKDGSVVYMSWSVSWGLANGAMHCVWRDITERYRARAALHESVERLHGVLESIGDGFFTLDKNWRVTYVNQIAAAFFDHEREGFVGLRLWSAIPSILDSPFLDTWRNAMEGGKAASFQTYHAPRNRWVEMRLYPHAEGMSVFFNDVTQKREAEKALWLSEQRFREVVEMTPAGYVLTDANCVIRSVNSALCELTGFPDSQLMGTTLEKLFVINPLDTLLQSDQRLIELNGVEGVVRHQLGHPVYVLINAHVRRDGGGELLSITAFLTDITARKHNELQVRQLATHDRLTGLPNRVYLDECLPDILGYSARGQINAVLFIDLDHFKEVNDTIGHAIGDDLLIEVSRRMKQQMRDGDIVARLGGDEFVVVAQCPDGEQSASRIAEKLVAAIAEPIELQGRQLCVGASIGIAIAPRDGTTKDELFAKADASMYQVKSSGRNGFGFYERPLSDLDEPEV